jgi:hypothetical protein
VRIRVLCGIRMPPWRWLRVIARAPSITYDSAIDHGYKDLRGLREDDDFPAAACQSWV